MMTLSNLRFTVQGAWERVVRCVRRPKFPLLSEEQALLAEAELRARRRWLFLQRLPLRIMILVPFALLMSLQSKAALMIVILVLGTVYLPIALLIACKFADILGPVEVHERRETARLRYERNRARAASTIGDDS